MGSSASQVLLDRDTCYASALPHSYGSTVTFPTKVGEEDLTAPPIMIGAWSWGEEKKAMNTFPGGQDPKNTIAANEEAFNVAMDAGCRWIDTAEVYGMGLSESLLGQFIRNRHAAQPDRPRPLIATKFVPHPFRWTSSAFSGALDGSLRRLGVECIDLYQVHGPMLSVRSLDVWAECMAEAVKNGKVRSIGVSNYNSQQLRSTIEVLKKHGLRLASNQIEYSLLHVLPERTGLLEMMAQENIACLCYSPLAQGVLSGKYAKDAASLSKRRTPAMKEDWDTHIKPLLDTMRAIAGKKGRTVTQVALSYCLAKGLIPIAGVKTKEQAEDCCACFFSPLESSQAETLLTSDEVKTLSELATPGQTTPWHGSSA